MEENTDTGFYRILVYTMLILTEHYCEQIKFMMKPMNWTLICVWDIRMYLIGIVFPKKCVSQERDTEMKLLQSLISSYL